MAELGLLGIVIPEEYGGAGLDFVSEALSCEEIERGEAAFRTLISVHVGLNSLSLLRYASEEQKERYLAPQARGEKLACFGLTEPEAGSDVAAMRTTARREGRRLRPERPEELDLLRDRRRPPARLREDRPRGEAQGHLGVHRRARVARRRDAGDREQARHLGRLDRRALLRERRGAGREPRRRGGPGLRDRHVRARPGPLHGRGRRLRRHPRLPRALGRVRARARDVRASRSASTSSSRT